MFWTKTVCSLPSLTRELFNFLLVRSPTHTHTHTHRFPFQCTISLSRSAVRAHFPESCVGKLFFYISVSYIHTHIFTHSWVHSIPQSFHPLSFSTKKLQLFMSDRSIHKGLRFHSYNPTPASWYTAHNTASHKITRESLYSLCIPAHTHTHIHTHTASTVHVMGELTSITTTYQEVFIMSAGGSKNLFQLIRQYCTFKVTVSIYI